MSEAQVWRIQQDRSAALAIEPPTDTLMMHVVDAWNTLDSCRSIGMAVGPIPWTAVRDWCSDQSWCDVETTRAVGRAINYLDAERARRDAAKSNQQRQGRKPPPRSK